MVVPSLAIRIWVEDKTFWAEAPWLEKPVSAPTWEEVYEIAMRLRAANKRD